MMHNALTSYAIYIVWSYVKLFSLVRKLCCAQRK